MTLHEVAKELGVSKTGVWIVLNRAGVLRSPAEAMTLRSEPLRRRLLEAWHRGLDAQECAAAVECEVDTARRHLRRAGFNPNARSRGLEGCGPLIREARQAAGLNQSELARRCGVVPSHICDYERGQWNPRRRTLRRIAQALGCPVERLIPESAEAIAAERLKPTPENSVRHAVPSRGDRKAVRALRPVGVDEP
jgi:transcriptional regulator with XRE-family HTH domain